MISDVSRIVLILKLQLQLLTLVDLDHKAKIVGPDLEVHDLGLVEHCLRWVGIFRPC